MIQFFKRKPPAAAAPSGPPTEDQVLVDTMKEAIDKAKEAAAKLASRNIRVTLFAPGDDDGWPRYFDPRIMTVFAITRDTKETFT